MPDSSERDTVRAGEGGQGPVQRPAAGGFHSPAPIFLPYGAPIPEDGHPQATYIRSARPSARDIELGVQPAPRQIFYPFLRGKLCVLLGMGLSHDEAANWAESHSPVIDALVEQDQPFADELKKCRAMSRLYPFLRIYLTSGESWRATEWLEAYLRRRQGEIENGEMLAHLAWSFEKFRPNLYSAEARMIQCAQQVPIGTRDFKREKT